MRDNFNSHAHVERDGVRNTHSKQTIISTHTLTWSVTSSSVGSSSLSVISTHTLTWSVTNDPYKIMVKDYHFNSHAHVERDGRK